jgi:hypothetical protein
MRKSMIAMLAMGCLIWVAADARGQGKKGGGGATTPMLESAADNMFQKLDKNGDGKLNLAEMPESLRNELIRFDKNRDGMIDRAEFREYFSFSASGGQPGGAGGPIPGGGKKGPMGAGGGAFPGGGQPGGFGGAGFGGFGGGGFGGGLPGGGFGPMMQGPAKPMTWEYRVLTRGSIDELGKDNLEAGLNALGAEGWELVSIDSSAKPTSGNRYIFRRPGAAKPRTDTKPAVAPASTEKADAKIDFRVYRMRHANAVEVARMLDELMRTGRSDSLRVVADPHTNSLLLKGPAQAQFDVEAILQHLDLPGEAEAARPGPNKKGGASPFKKGFDKQPQ